MWLGAVYLIALVIFSFAVPAMRTAALRPPYLTEYDAVTPILDRRLLEMGAK
jgi:hypothetical protein